MEPKNQQVAKHSRFVHFTFCLWLASVGVLITVLLAYTGPSIITVFESLEVDLPGVTVLSLNTGVFLRTGLGLLIALGVVVVLALPFVLGSRSKATAKAYGALAIVTLLAAAACWFSVTQPIRMLQKKLGEPELMSPR